MLPYKKNNAWFFQRLIKQSQSFEKSHAIAKTTKHTIKMTSSIKHDMQNSKPQSKQAPICTTIGMKIFLFSNNIQPFLKQLF
jgi:hypothetical protein